MRRLARELCVLRDGGGGWFTGRAISHSHAVTRGGPAHASIALRVCGSGAGGELRRVGAAAVVAALTEPAAARQTLLNSPRDLLPHTRRAILACAGPPRV